LVMALRSITWEAEMLGNAAFLSKLCALCLVSTPALAEAEASCPRIPVMDEILRHYTGDIAAGLANASGASAGIDRRLSASQALTLYPHAVDLAWSLTCFATICMTIDQEHIIGELRVRLKLEAHRMCESHAESISNSEISPRPRGFAA
jgi:hypothetical protein